MDNFQNIHDRDRANVRIQMFFPFLLSVIIVHQQGGAMSLNRVVPMSFQLQILHKKIMIDSIRLQDLAKLSEIEWFH